MTPTIGKTYQFGPVSKYNTPFSWKKRYLSINFRLDDIKVRITRKEYTFEMWFAAIGGIESIYRRLFGVMVWGVTFKSFTNALLGSIFYMKKNRDAHRNYDPDDPNDPTYEGLPDGERLEPVVNDASKFVTDREKRDYDALKKDIADGDVGPESIRNIMLHMIQNREKFCVVNQKEDF
jgi:hypothetical protein